MRVPPGLGGLLGALGFYVVVRPFGRFPGVLRSIFAHLVLLCAGVSADSTLGFGWHAPIPGYSFRGVKSSTPK